VDETNEKISDIKWLIAVGDLIRVTTYSINAYGKVSYGIVVAKEEENQLFLFPSVNVFMFGSRIVETFPAGRVEVISGKYL